LTIVLVEVDETKEVEKAVAEHSYHPDTTLFVQAIFYENIPEFDPLALEAGADKSKLLSIFEAVANASVGEQLRRYRPMGRQESPCSRSGRTGNTGSCSGVRCSPQTKSRT
jgi:hypothetical protein